MARKFYTAQDRPALGTLVHNLEHGYTILWYDDSVAGSSTQMSQIRAIADKFAGTDDLRDKFKAVPWTADDGKAFPSGQHIAFTHWSVGGTQNAAAGQAKQVGVWQYCSAVSGAALKTFMTDYPYSDSPEPNGDVSPDRSGQSGRDCRSRSTSALTSWARSRVVTSSASGVSTTTTSSSPTTATTRPLPRHDQAGGVDAPARRRRRPSDLRPRLRSVAEQRGQRVRSRRCRPSRRSAGTDGDPARRRPRARRRRGRWRSSAAPATARRAAPGRRRSRAARRRARGATAASRSSSTVGRTTNMPAFQRYSPGREVGRGARSAVRLLDELRRPAARVAEPGRAASPSSDVAEAGRRVGRLDADGDQPAVAGDRDRLAHARRGTRPRRRSRGRRRRSPITASGSARSSTRRPARSRPSSRAGDGSAITWSAGSSGSWRDAPPSRVGGAGDDEHPVAGQRREPVARSPGAGSGRCR